MIPQTVVGFFFFLLLVAPGVGYELLRERRTPKFDESAFREASRVALYSFGFSFSALAIISLLRMCFPTDLFDLGAYSRDSMGYVKSHYTPVLRTVVFEVLLAFTLVVVVDRINAAKPYSRIYQTLPKPLRRVLASDIRRHGIWWDILVASRPKGQIAQLNIRLSDGSRVIGFFHMCTAYDSFDKAEICIKRGAAGPLLLLDTQDPNEQKPEGRKSRQLDQDDFIWVRGEDISYMRVRYKPVHAGTQPTVKQPQPQPPPIVGGPAPSASANPAAAMATEDPGEATDGPAQTRSW
jgi:hypothetical protein